GPLSNVLLVLISAVGIKLALWLGGPPLQQEFYLALVHQSSTAVGACFMLALMFVQINCILAIFNMIPIPPLDGGTVFYFTVVRFHPKLEQIWMHVRQFGFLIVYVLAT